MVSRAAIVALLSASVAKAANAAEVVGGQLAEKPDPEQWPVELRIKLAAALAMILILWVIGAAVTIWLGRRLRRTLRDARSRLVPSVPNLKAASKTTGAARTPRADDLSP